MKVIKVLLAPAISQHGIGMVGRNEIGLQWTWLFRLPSHTVPRSCVTMLDWLSSISQHSEEFALRRLRGGIHHSRSSV